MSDLDKLLATAVLGLLGKIVWDWLKGRKNGNINGHSGAKSTEFWVLEIRKIVEDVMDRRDARIRSIMEDVLNRRRR